MSARRDAGKCSVVLRGTVTKLLSMTEIIDMY